MVQHSMVATTLQLEGYKIKKSLGVVRGITVRSRSVIGQFGASIQTIFGGNISILTDLCEKARAEAFDVMLNHADGMGANAIVGVHYDANELMEGVTEVLCYGTAVVVEPL